MLLTYEEHIILCDKGQACNEHASILALILRECSLSCPAYPDAEEAALLWQIAYHHNGPSTLTSISAIIEAEDAGQHYLAIQLARKLLEESEEEYR